MGLFKKATRTQSKLRLGLYGPSGSGKTMTALRLAQGLGKTTAVIDTERGSASLYAGLQPGEAPLDFDVLELEADKGIEALARALTAAAKEGYDTVVIDSLSHAWKELLTEVDRLTSTKYKGNSWSAWSEGTPKQARLVDALLAYPGHVIATMRSKTEWTTETGRDGKSKPVRVGLAPEQGKGIEYEFSILLEMSTENIGTVIKDRTGLFQGRMIERPGEEFGRELLVWLSDGAPAPVAAPASTPVAAPAPAARPAAPTPQASGEFPPDPPEGLFEGPRGSEASISPAQLKLLAMTCKKHDLIDRGLAQRFIGWSIGRAIESSKDLSKAEAHNLLSWTDDDWMERLEAFTVAQVEPPVEAVA